MARAATAAVQAARYTDAADGRRGRRRRRPADRRRRARGGARRRWPPSTPPSARSGQPWAPSRPPAAQQARNTAALTGWQDYLGQLAVGGHHAAARGRPGRRRAPARGPGPAARRRRAAGPRRGHDLRRRPHPHRAARRDGRRGQRGLRPAGQAVPGRQSRSRRLRLRRAHLHGVDCGRVRPPGDADRAVGRRRPGAGGQLQVGDLVFSTDARTAWTTSASSSAAPACCRASADRWQVAVRDRGRLARRPGDRARVDAGRPAGLRPGHRPPAARRPARRCRRPARSDGAWGGWRNGRIPADALCSVGGGHRLRCDAAASYNAMSAAYAGDVRLPAVHHRLLPVATPRR